jgi:capsular polysaccharide biosynthesis protein
VELRAYAGVLWRWRWLLGGALAAALLVSLTWMVLVPPTYKVQVDLLIVPEIPEGTDLRQYPIEYYRMLLTEFRIDDITQIVKSRHFAQAVRAEMGTAGSTLDEQTITNAITARKKHRTLQLTVRGQDPNGTLRLAQAVQRVIEQKSGEYFASGSVAAMRVTTLNPAIEAKPPSLLERSLELGLRLIAALVVALGAVILLEYTNDTLRDATDVSRALELPVLAQIPLEQGPALAAVSSPGMEALPRREPAPRPVGDTPR